MHLIEVLPDYYDDNETMQELQKILSQQSNALEEELSNVIDQVFWIDATGEGLLSRHERIFNIVPDNIQSDKYRRERISAKVSGVGTTTKAMIKDVSSRYSNGEVEITEDNANSRFVIRFVGTLGIPGNIEGLKKTIEEIKPAHLGVAYVYVYNTWKDVGKLTWGQAAEYTWKEIREVKINGDKDRTSSINYA